MQKDIIVCHFDGINVTEVFKNIPKPDKWARKAVVLHNASIVAEGGNLDNEFWFLNEKIKSKSTIITLGADNDVIKDDPAVLERLGKYIATPASGGNAKNRGTDDDLNKTRGDFR